jgi:coenzyme F420-dependent glucose-6-phosphate dehydrogenase
MAEIGYHLSSEEHMPNDLVRFAHRAEHAGFRFITISDHYHPWIDQQGQAPFVWNVLGAIAHVTHEVPVGTAVTCPTFRIHPAIIAQAAASTAAMMPGRFFLGLGSGENLNEHILAQRWPPPDIRLEMLEEAIDMIRLLWEGEEASYYGEYYDVEDARIYTLPDQPPPIVVAASGQNAAELAGRAGDGLMSTAPEEEVIQQYVDAGGRGKPRYGKVTVCWAESEEEGVEMAFKVWPNTGIKGNLNAELPKPSHFEQATQMVTKEDIKGKIVCGPDVERHLQIIRKYIDAGFDHLFVHQVGPHQEDFFQFYEKHILPEFL